MRIRNRLFWLAAMSGIILDQLTKVWVMNTFELTNPPEIVTILPGVLNFTYVVNTGAAWSLFSENGEWLKWLSLAVSIGLAAFGLMTRMPDRWEQIGYGFILGGALGNGIDRMRTGEVVDFIQVFPVTKFPVFNLADIWINVGILCLLLSFFWPSGNGNGKKTKPR